LLDQKTKTLTNDLHTQTAQLNAEHRSELLKIAAALKQIKADKQQQDKDLEHYKSMAQKWQETPI
jgi:hypothetical protein